MLLCVRTILYCIWLLLLVQITTVWIVSWKKKDRMLSLCCCCFFVVVCCWLGSRFLCAASAVSSTVKRSTGRSHTGRSFHIVVDSTASGLLYMKMKLYDICGARVNVHFDIIILSDSHELVVKQRPGTKPPQGKWPKTQKGKHRERTKVTRLILES